MQVRWRRTRSESGGGIRGSGGRTVGRPSATHVVCQCGEVRSLSREACRQKTGDDRWEPADLRWQAGSRFCVPRGVQRR